MTPPDTTPRQALELLEALRDRAESAAAARLEQMHGHLSTNHRASGYDGTAAQIHAQYAQALASIVQALRAQAEAEAGEVTMAQAVISYHRERAWAAHALPGSRDRIDHEHNANEALWTLRSSAVQQAAQAIAARAQAGGESQ